MCSSQAKKGGRLGMSGKKGFTLVELLIVVIVIGILASIAVPQYTTVIERSKVGKAKNALTIIVKAQNIAFAQTGGYLSTLTGAGSLTDYIDMDAVNADTDWTYTTDSTNGSATATRAGTGTTIITLVDSSIDMANSTHPLK